MNLQLDQTAGCALVHHHIIERQGLEHRLPIAQHPRREKRTLFGGVQAIEQLPDLVQHVTGGDIGHETQTPLIHTHQRHAVAGQMARGIEHAAIAAQHHRQIGLRADLRIVERIHLRQSAIACSFALEQNPAAALSQERRQLGQGRGHTRRVIAPDQRHLLEGRLLG